RPAKPVLGTVAAVLGKDQATLVSTDLENANVQSPRLVEGRWPNTDQVFPKGKPRFTINVDARLLIDLLHVGLAFSSQDHNNKVTMELHDGTQLISRGWDRKRCKEEIRAAGVPVRLKSSCFFCPAMKPQEIDELPKHLLRRIVIMEARAKPRLTDLDG